MNKHERDLAQANAANPNEHEPPWATDRDEGYVYAEQAADRAFYEENGYWPWDDPPSSPGWEDDDDDDDDDD